MKRDDEEALGIPAKNDRTVVEMEEDWLYFHLDVARRARQRIEDLDVGEEYAHEIASRRAALLGAMKHFDLLRRMKSPLPALLEQMMLAEGL